MSVTKNKDKIVALAAKYKWKLREDQTDIGLLIFEKMCSVFDGDTINGHAQINVYTTTMTVTTIVNHPKRGRGQMYRRDVDWRFLDWIFKNPRVHASRFKHPGGYFPKRPAAPDFATRFMTEDI